MWDIKVRKVVYDWCGWWVWNCSVLLLTPMISTHASAISVNMPPRRVTMTVWSNYLISFKGSLYSTKTHLWVTEDSKGNGGRILVGSYNAVSEIFYVLHPKMSLFSWTHSWMQHSYVTNIKNIFLLCKCTLNNHISWIQSLSDMYVI